MPIRTNNVTHLISPTRLNSPNRKITSFLKGRDKEPALYSIQRNDVCYMPDALRLKSQPQQPQIEGEGEFEVGRCR